MKNFKNNKIKSRIKKTVQLFGLDVVKFKKRELLDLSKTDYLDPISAIYASKGESILIKVPLFKCRFDHMLANTCSLDSQSAFIQTLLLYQKGECTSYKESPLKAFYDDFQPQSIADLLSFSDPCNPILSTTSPLAALWPWSNSTLSESFNRQKLNCVLESRQHGFDLTYNDGSASFGPVSLEKGELEFHRTITIYEKLKKESFRVDSGGVDNIVCSILYLDDISDWRVLIHAGNHRMAALTVLGYDSITVQINANRGGLFSIIRKLEIDSWPAVRQGYYSKDEARAIFDKLFVAG